MAKKLGTRTLVVIRAPKVDRLAPKPVGAPPEHEIEDCAVLPRTSFEEERGWVVVEGRQVFAPFGSDILATDIVKIKGETEEWEVDGEPGDYENRRGKGKAMILYLKRQ